MKTCKTLMLATVFSFAVASVWNAGVALAAIDIFLDLHRRRRSHRRPLQRPPPISTGSSTTKGGTNAGRRRARLPRDLTAVAAATINNAAQAAT